MNIYPECKECVHLLSDINGACGICTKTTPSQFIRRKIIDQIRGLAGKSPDMIGEQLHDIADELEGPESAVQSVGNLVPEPLNQGVDGTPTEQQRGNHSEEIFPEELTNEPCPECGSKEVFRNIYGEWKCISCGINRYAPDAVPLCECGHERWVHYQNQGFCSFYQGEGCTCQTYRPGK